MPSALFGSALASLLQAGVESDTAIQNSVMRLAKQQGQSPAQLEQYLIRLHQLGLKPEEQTYNILLRAYAEHGDLKAAAEILDRMGADGTQSGLWVLCSVWFTQQQNPACFTVGASALISLQRAIFPFLSCVLHAACSHSAARGMLC